MSAEADEASGSAPAESSTPADHSDSKKGDELDFSKDKEFEILGKMDDDWRDHMASVGGAQPYTSEDAERRQHFFDSLVSETSLQEHLMQQAELADLGADVLAALRHLVGGLDESRLPHPVRVGRRVADRPAPLRRPGCDQGPQVLRTARHRRQRISPSASCSSSPPRDAPPP